MCLSHIDLYIFQVGNIFLKLGWPFNVVTAIYKNKKKYYYI